MKFINHTSNRLLDKFLMKLTINQKFIALFIILFMYDIWSEWFFYIIKIAFEFTEYYLEEGLQNILGVNQHFSEIIALNFFLFLAVSSMIKLWFLSPRIFHYTYLLIEEIKQEFLIFWQSLTLFLKIKLSAIYLLISLSVVTYLFL